MAENYSVDDRVGVNFETKVNDGNGAGAINIVEQLGACRVPNLLEKANLDAAVWGHGFQIVDSAANTDGDSVRISLFRRDYDPKEWHGKTIAVTPIGTTKELPRCKD